MDGAPGVHIDTVLSPVSEVLFSSARLASEMRVLDIGCGCGATTLALALRVGPRGGGFFHDGRFATLLDVVNHYNDNMNLNLSETEKKDLIEYLKGI